MHGYANVWGGLCGLLLQQGVHEAHVEQLSSMCCGRFCTTTYYLAALMILFGAGTGPLHML